LEWKAGDVLPSPNRSFGINETLQVVTLEANYLSDMHHQLSEGLSRTPIITDADFLWINIRMKYGCNHSAKRRAARIIQRKKNPCLMLGNRCCTIPRSKRCITPAARSELHLNPQSAIANPHLSARIAHKMVIKW
jgi:hypothetical protein